MRKTRVTKCCVICGKSFELKLSHASYIQCCSIICGAEFKQRRFDKEIEAKLNVPIKEWLFKYYVGQLWTYRQICTELNINTRTLMRYMRQFNVPVRNPSESVRNQWVRNPNRKLNSRNIIAKGAPKRAIYFRQHPQGCETALFNALSRRGIKFEFQYVVDSYILDFALPEYYLDIELDNPRRAGRNLDRLDKTKKRTANLNKLGWNCLYFRTDTDPSLIADTVQALINNR